MPNKRVSVISFNSLILIAGFLLVIDRMVWNARRSVSPEARVVQAAEEARIQGMVSTLRTLHEGDLLKFRDGSMVKFVGYGVGGRDAAKDVFVHLRQMPSKGSTDVWFVSNRIEDLAARIKDKKDIIRMSNEDGSDNPKWLPCVKEFLGVLRPDHVPCSSP
jgi:hypothetical protein